MPFHRHDTRLNLTISPQLYVYTIRLIKIWDGAVFIMRYEKYILSKISKPPLIWDVPISEHKIVLNSIYKLKKIYITSLIQLAYSEKSQKWVEIP